MRQSGHAGGVEDDRAHLNTIRNLGRLPFTPDLRWRASTSERPSSAGNLEMTRVTPRV
jgi:hypothetical protein